MSVLRSKEYFGDRATRDMKENLHPEERDLKETLAYACRILAMTGHEAGLAGQISARSVKPKCYWTLRFGLGFDEATPEDFSRSTPISIPSAAPAWPIRRPGSICGFMTRDRIALRSSIRIRHGYKPWYRRGNPWSLRRWTPRLSTMIALISGIGQACLSRTRRV